MRLAAQQGVRQAQSRLAAMQETGRGVARDDGEPYLWGTLAAAQGDEGARQRRERLARSITPDQREGAERRAPQLAPARDG